MKANKNPITPINAWWCESCKTDELTHPQMMAHLTEKHGLETRGLKCQKKLLMHVDGSDFYQSSYEVTCQGSYGKEIKLHNQTRNPRNPAWR